MSNDEYKVIDSGNFQKLEKVGPYTIVRPSLGAIWQPKQPQKAWDSAHAVFKRKNDGTGKWQVTKRIPDSWPIQIGNLRFNMKMTDFGHLGIFPEQYDYWAWIEQRISAKISKQRDYSVLNLFAYTGGSTMAAAKGGAQVVHLDASKTSVAWAKENADLCGIGDKPIRWIVDDVKKFIAREVRRKAQYDAIILDPPSYGRGKKGEIWKIEDDLPELLTNLKMILKRSFDFLMLSAHTPGYTPIALQNLVADFFGKECRYEAREMTIEEVETGRELPHGAGIVVERLTP
ncbi:MAG: class I SAM-dependent methyltransferase [Oligoflexales bacterium]